MIKIFNSTDTDFSTAGNIIINPTKCIETRKKSLNGWYIDVEMPIKYKDDVQQDMLCVVKTKSKLKPQAFRIKNIEKKQRKIVFQARHVMFDAEDYFLLDVRPTNQNGHNALNYINERTDKTSPFTVFSNVTTQDTAYFVRKNLLEAWMTIEERWGGVFDADNWDIQFMTKIGNDNGETIMYGKDMTGISVYEDWSSVVTKLYPVGYNGLMLPEKFLESNIQYEIPYTRTIDFSTSLETEEQTEVNLLKELRRNALEYLDENKIPKVSYTVTANVNERLEMGDTVHVKHPLCNILTEVVEYVYNSISQKLKSITFGNYSRDVKAKFDMIKDNINKVAEKMTTQEIVIAKQTELINSLNKNGLVYIDENEILILDKLPREEAKNVWRFGLGGIGFSSNGYEGPFETAITMDGQINADFITTGTMNVARIEGLTDTLNKINVAIELNSSNVKIVVDKQNANEKKLAQITNDINEIKSEISNITDITTTLKGQGVLNGIGINESEPILIKIHPVGNDITPLYPNNKLYPSDSLYPHDRELIFKQINVEEGKVADYIEYNLPVNLYYLNENVYDEFYMNYETQECYVISRVGFDEQGNKYALEREGITDYEYRSIHLGGGDYEIKMSAFLSAYIEIKLMLKNTYTSQFATQVQLHSAIDQTENAITQNVNAEITKANGKIDKISGELSLKLDTNKLVSTINAQANIITITSDYFKLSAEGHITATGGSIGGFTITKNSLRSNSAGFTSNEQVAFWAGAKLYGGHHPFEATWDGTIYALNGVYTWMNNHHVPVISTLADNFDGIGVEVQRIFRNQDTYTFTFAVANSGTWSIQMNPPSDKKLKDNIRDTDIVALDIINQIKFRQFDWNDNYKKLGFTNYEVHEKFGVVADELELINKKFVIDNKQKDGSNLKTINREELIYYNLKATQELYELQNKILKRLERLENG